MDPQCEFLLSMFWVVAWTLLCSKKKTCLSNSVKHSLCKPSVVISSSSYLKLELLIPQTTELGVLKF